jgi:hypothetical protein
MSVGDILLKIFIMLLGLSFHDKIYFMFCFSVFLFKFKQNGRQIQDKFAVNLDA